MYRRYRGTTVLMCTVYRMYRFKITEVLLYVLKCTVVTEVLLYVLKCTVVTVRLVPQCSTVQSPPPMLKLLYILHSSSENDKITASEIERWKHFSRSMSF